MTQEELGFYNKQDKEELVIMCIARDNKIEHLRKKNDALITVIDLVKEYINKNKRVIRELYSANSGSMKFYELCIDPDELLEILERVNEE